MHRIVRLTLATVLVFALLLTVVSCHGNRARIIPDETLSKICADMLLADQWIANQNLLRDLDTVLVYEPVFDKYGYTSADFYATVDKHMYNPSKFARVLTESQMILQERAGVLDRRMADQRKNIKKHYDSGFRLSGVGVSLDTLSKYYEMKSLDNKQE